MRMKMKTGWTLLWVGMSLFLGAAAANAQQSGKDKEAEKALEAFPVAEAGMVRHVIQVKKQKDESAYKVEIIPGKEMLVDCNLHVLMGQLEEKDLQGWGYNYYVFTSNGQTRSTMMACNEPDEMRFVQAQALTVRYNSRLPIVVYAPVGYEIKYRIWKADPKLKESDRK